MSSNWWERSKREDLTSGIFPSDHKPVAVARSVVKVYSSRLSSPLHLILFKVSGSVSMLKVKSRCSAPQARILNHIKWGSRSNVDLFIGSLTWKVWKVLTHRHTHSKKQCFTSCLVIGVQRSGPSVKHSSAWFTGLVKAGPQSLSDQLGSLAGATCCIIWCVTLCKVNWQAVKSKAWLDFTVSLGLSE